MSRRVKLLAGVLVVFGLVLLARAKTRGPREPLQGAEERIQELRTRSVILEVRDPAGEAVPNAGLHVRMRRHQFLFGANVYMYQRFSTPELNAQYENLFADLFNYATVPFYYSSYEPKRGETQAERLEAMVAWCRERGITVKGHPLIWHSPQAVPSWVPDDAHRVEELHYERITDIVGRFKGRIDAYDILNEPTSSWLFDSPVSTWEAEIGPVETARRGLAWAEKADPDATLLVNDYNVRWELHWVLPAVLPHRTLGLLFTRVRHYPFSYAGYLADLAGAGGEYDAIGIQSHMHYGPWSLRDVWNTIERYAFLERPVHWTEVTVLSGEGKVMRPDTPEKNLPWPTTPEGERAQAEYVEQFYTLLFSHPSVEAITWWDLSDEGAWMQAPAGLVRADLTPKPAYERLRTLIRETWWTQEDVRTDVDGRATVHGYCGDYTVSGANVPEGISFAIDCRAQNQPVVHITVETTP